jgi:hypothetical protein
LPGAAGVGCLDLVAQIQGVFAGDLLAVVWWVA